TARIRRANGTGPELVQNGTFTITNGSIIPAGEPEPRTGNVPAAAARTNTASEAATKRRPPVRAFDNVIADDLIVDGAACVGLDCADGETFGNEQLKLKANTVRLKFEDSSNTAGFATNDWQLSANEQAAGGDARFYLEDLDNSKIPFTVRASAPNNSLFINTNGKVGFRTSSPLLDLHMATTDTPAIRFEQTNGGGFAAQTWDVGANEANFFVRDLTGGSRLVFRIRPGAPTSSLDISASGNVGVGTGLPHARLDVSDSTQNASRITLSGQEFLRATTTSTDGIAVLLGVNRTGNRQMWITDSTMLNGPTPALRFAPNT